MTEKNSIKFWKYKMTWENKNYWKKDSLVQYKILFLILGKDYCSMDGMKWNFANDLKMSCINYLLNDPDPKH